jgi:hypothetical protein
MPAMEMRAAPTSSLSSVCTSHDSPSRTAMIDLGVIGGNLFITSKRSNPEHFAPVYW